jgi:hypothetical protein
VADPVFAATVLRIRRLLEHSDGPDPRVTSPHVTLAH